MNHIVEICVSTPEELKEAMSLSKYCFWRKSVISIQYNYGVEKIRREIREIDSDFSYCFAGTQLEEYSTDISTELGKGYNVGITSIFNADVEDLIYLGSEIAEILNQEILNSEDPYEKIKKFDEFIKESFQLKSPNKIGRYLANILSKNSAKLYQTVSAIATLTLSQMGIKTLLIYGKAHEIHSWKPHVWNAVKIHGAWVHVDFGYSISSMFLPNSMSLLEEKSFVATHLWNHEAYNDTSMELAWQKTYPRYKASIRADEKTIVLNGVSILLEEPLMIYRNNRLWIDLLSLIRILGGFLLVDSDSGFTNIYLNNCKKPLKTRMEQYKNRFFDIKILDDFCSCFHDGINIEIDIYFGN